MTALHRLATYGKRLFQVVLPFAVALVVPGPASALTSDEMRSRTAVIATRYLDVWSSNAAASVEGVPYIYGPRVSFYGQDYSQADLIAEKRRALRQWPVRRYVHRPGTMTVTCNDARLRCVASSTMDFAVSNPARGTAKSGAANFQLGVAFDGPLPRILFEGGSLNRRRR